MGPDIDCKNKKKHQTHKNSKNIKKNISSQTKKKKTKQIIMKKILRLC